MGGQALRAQQDIVARYRRVSNLYVAYTNSDGTPEEYGREFTIAVGELLEGQNINQLELFHINVDDVEDIVSYGKKEEARSAHAAGKRVYQKPAERKQIQNK